MSQVFSQVCLAAGGFLLGVSFMGYLTRATRNRAREYHRKEALYGHANGTYQYGILQEEEMLAMGYWDNGRPYRTYYARKAQKEDEE